MFLPYNYVGTLYHQLQILRQGNRSIEDYSILVIRTSIAETQHNLVSRFQEFQNVLIGGLR